MRKRGKRNCKASRSVWKKTGEELLTTQCNFLRYSPATDFTPFCGSFPLTWVYSRFLFRPTQTISLCILYPVLYSFFFPWRLKTNVGKAANLMYRAVIQSLLSNTFSSFSKGSHASDRMIVMINKGMPFLCSLVVEGYVFGLPRLPI